jgi:two-component system response regulator
VNSGHEKIPILVADDSKEDCQLLKLAFENARVPNPLHCVPDGEALLAYLRGSLGPNPPHPEPGLILMDLNMPRMGGKETLKALRADPALNHIPVLIVSTSAYHEEVIKCYRLGANAFLVKPFDFGDFVALLASSVDYWMNKVELPRNRRFNVL